MTNNKPTNIRGIIDYGKICLCVNTFLLAIIYFCEAQARVRQGSDKDGQGLVNKRPLMAPNGLNGLSTLA